MKQAYITALVDSLRTSSDVDAVLKNTEALLKKKGHTRVWPAVLRGVVRELEKRVSSDTPRVYVAKESDASLEAVRNALAALGAGQTYETKVDTSLIGGFVVAHKDKLFDASYKRRLVDLYRSITK